MKKFVVKLTLFSGVLLFVYLANVLFFGTCYISHGGIGFLCSLWSSFLLYAALLMSINLAWKVRSTLSVFSGLMPIPIFIYDALHMNLIGMFDATRPGYIDQFNFYFTEISIPCIIVAVAISYTTNKETVNAL